MEEEELVVEQQNSRLVGPMRGVRARAGGDLRPSTREEDGGLGGCNSVFCPSMKKP